MFKLVGLISNFYFVLDATCWLYKLVQLNEKRKKLICISTCHMYRGRVHNI